MLVCWIVTCVSVGLCVCVFVYTRARTHRHTHTQHTHTYTACGTCAACSLPSFRFLFSGRLLPSASALTRVPPRCGSLGRPQCRNLLLPDVLPLCLQQRFLGSGPVAISPPCPRPRPQQDGPFPTLSSVQRLEHLCQASSAATEMPTGMQQKCQPSPAGRVRLTLPHDSHKAPCRRRPPSALETKNWAQRLPPGPVPVSRSEGACEASLPPPGLSLLPPPPQC